MREHLGMEFLATWIADLLIGRSSDYAPRTLLGWTSVGLLAGLIAQIFAVRVSWLWKCCLGPVKDDLGLHRHRGRFARARSRNPC